MQDLDLRVVEIQDRRGQQGVTILGGISIVVGGGAMLALGYYIVTKFWNKVDQSGFTADQNTSFDSMQGEVNDAFEFSGFILWVSIAAAALLLVMGIVAVVSR